nr:hypothetical protein [Tanacetum cinerariifolium]
MPHEALPRVTSLGGVEGSMQQKLQEFMDICTSLQRQHSLIEERVQSQDLEITQLKTRVKTLEDNERRREGFAQEDAPNTEGMDQGEDLLVEDTVKVSDKNGILTNIRDKDPITTPLENLITLVVGVATLVVVKITAVGKLSLAVATAGETLILAVATNRLAAVKTDLKPPLARI